jgi:WD40 repeat protein
VLSVALTPDGKWVLSGSKDRGVQFWDPRTGETQLMLQGHKNSGKVFESTVRGVDQPLGMMVQ